MYDVSESVGSVDLGVIFISGNAGELVPHVIASTVDGTATGPGKYKHYIALGLHPVLLFYSKSQAVIVVVKQTTSLLLISQSLSHPLTDIRMSQFR